MPVIFLIKILQLDPQNIKNLFPGGGGVILGRSRASSRPPLLRVSSSDLNGPEGLIVGSLPSGEEQTDDLLDVVAWPKDEVHLLRAANHILQIE